MNLKSCLIGFLAMFLTCEAPAAVISVDGVLDGGLIGPGDVGDTQDYLKFEVTSSDPITIRAQQTSVIEFLIGEFHGFTTHFGIPDSPFRLDWDCLGLFCEDSPPMELTRSLDPGVYIIVTLTRENNSYDQGDGFEPFNDEGGGFSIGPYSYEVEGPVKPLEYWEGHLGGTFTITNLVPEPSAAALLALSLAICFRRRRVAGERDS